MYSTQASATLCRRCGAAILNAWDDGLLARVDPDALDAAVVDALPVAAPGCGRGLYRLTAGRHLVQVMPETREGPPFGSFHLEHVC